MPVEKYALLFWLRLKNKCSVTLLLFITAYSIKCFTQVQICQEKIDHQPLILTNLTHTSEKTPLLKVTSYVMHY